MASLDRFLSDDFSLVGNFSKGMGAWIQKGEAELRAQFDADVHAIRLALEASDAIQAKDDRKVCRQDAWKIRRRELCKPLKICRDKLTRIKCESCGDDEKNEEDQLEEEERTLQAVLDGEEAAFQREETRLKAEDDLTPAGRVLTSQEIQKLQARLTVKLPVPPQPEVLEVYLLSFPCVSLILIF